MDISFKHFIEESTDIWHNIMDQLNELREWQKTQEEVVRERQHKQIDSLTQQNTKLNALTTDVTLDSTKDCPSTECHQMTDSLAINFDDSVEEIRTKEEFNQSTDYNPFVNNSYSENCTVVSAINGKDVKTFEDFLNLKLKDKNIDLSPNNTKKPIKPFLRKGEGIKRFESNKRLTNVSTNEKQRKVCFKTNDTKELKDKPRPKRPIKTQYFVKQFINKPKKSDENDIKPKQFIRKVIPMTTKSEKIDRKSIEISRHTPTVIIDHLNESESELIDYLRQIYANISIDDSFDDKFKNKDINELQDLLKKIETRKVSLQKRFDSNSPENEPQFSGSVKSFETTNRENSKKKVHWSQIQTLSDCESDEEVANDLIQPKSGAYSFILKQQIHELEDQLSRLKNMKNHKLIDSSVTKSNENSEPINGEIIKLRQQIEKLNERIVNIESKAYDLSSTQLKDISNIKKNANSFVGRNKMAFSKTICSPTGPNILVNENSNDTTIDFPNGDKMTVSKDNTILYSFANGTTQTTYPDGFKITHFPNGQTEKIDRNGVKRITYANGMQRIINADTSEEVIMTDGTVWRIYSDGSEVLEFTDGDREIRTNKYKRREYRNGNIKTLYSDGTEETRYINGRLRIKDKFGNLMVDSMAKHLNQHI